VLLRDTPARVLRKMATRCWFGSLPHAPAVRGVLNVRAEISLPASAVRSARVIFNAISEPSRMTSESDLQKFLLTTFATTHQAGVGVTLPVIEGNFGVADPKAVSLARQKGGAS
jgi:hypothetical protein